MGRSVPSFQDTVDYEVRDLTIATGDDVAFSYSLNRMSGTMKNGLKTELWLRWTACFRKINGKWLIVQSRYRCRSTWRAAKRCWTSSHSQYGRITTCRVPRRAQQDYRAQRHQYRHDRGGAAGRISNDVSSRLAHSSRAFESVMNLLSADFHVVAIDLPGVGRSTGHSRGDKRTAAGYVHAVIQAARLTNGTLVGHDLGGQIVYAYLHEFPKPVMHAAILNVAVPAIDPWSEVLRHPYIWHFAFHAIVELPETLVAGHQKAYFDILL